MSMFVLNSSLSERYPTVTNGLMYTYPMDGEVHCCVFDKKCARVLIIDCGDDTLYNYFKNKGSVIASVSMDSNLENIQAVEGQYNLVAIDGKDIVFSKEVLDKVFKLSKDIKTSFIIKSANEPKTIYNYGGSFVYMNKSIKEKDIDSAITKSSLHTALYNANIKDDGLYINNGFFKIPWDNRHDDFSISMNLELGSLNGNMAGIACIASDIQLLGILYNNTSKKILIEDKTSEVVYEISNEVNISTESLIVITKKQNLISIYINDKICTKAYIQTSTKGNELAIGNNTLSNTSNTSNMYISRLSVFDRALNTEDIEILSKGRLIFT